MVMPSLYRLVGWRDSPSVELAEEEGSVFVLCNVPKPGCEPARAAKLSEQRELCAVVPDPKVDVVVVAAAADCVYSFLSVRPAIRKTSADSRIQKSDSAAKTRVFGGDWENEVVDDGDAGCLRWWVRCATAQRHHAQKRK